jgi:hypothetical protein
MNVLDELFVKDGSMHGESRRPIEAVP